MKCPGYPTNVLKWSSKHQGPKSGHAHSIAEPSSLPAAKKLKLPRIAVSSDLSLDTAARETPSAALDPATPVCAQTAWSGTQGQHELHYLVNGVDAGAKAWQSSSFAGNHEAEALDAEFETLLSPHTNFDSLLMSSPTETFEKDDCQDYFLYTSGDADVEDGEHDWSARELIFPDELTTTDTGSVPTDSMLVPFVACGNRRGGRSASFPLSPALLHKPTLLVEYYFHKVCRDCSTFDSYANPFRSDVSNLQQMSAPLHHTIQSLAAAKLADDMPSMKVIGLEAQGQALLTLKAEFSEVKDLAAVSDEVLYTLLLLGMTTSWHVREDLGLQYLRLARRVITAKGKSRPRQVGQQFFSNALIYWTMIASVVSGDVEVVDDSFACIALPDEPVLLPEVGSVMPHAWAGISSRTLELFGQILQLIRGTRTQSQATLFSSYSRATMDRITIAISKAEALETECWQISIPSVHMLKDTGDLHTPRLDHVLTAKAYLLSALLQLYTVFPDVLQARIQSVLSLETAVIGGQHKQHTEDFAHVMSQESLWSRRSCFDLADLWLKDVAFQIIQCLERVSWRSSTRVVHPPILLSVSSALTLSKNASGCSGRSSEFVLISQPVEKADCSPHQVVEDYNSLIRRSRSFVIDRLETMQSAMRFHAISNVLKVVNEVWARADAGRQDVYWMDIMSELQCETIFG